MLGWAETTTGDNVGVKGVSLSTSGAGVYGIASASSGTTYGVFGAVNSPNGYGLYTPNNVFAGGTVTAASFVGSGAGLTALPAWQLGGNSGTTAGTHFLGTTDNQALELKVNNTRAFRLEPSVLGAIFGPNLIGGDAGNFVAPGLVGGTISGGGDTACGINQISAGHYATICGGCANTVNADWGTVGGGHHNTSAHTATVAGGQLNNAIGQYSTVGGGSDNTASGESSTVTGGTINDATGLYSVVPGGIYNLAGGRSSFAAGNQAKANHDGAFVWGDATGADVVSIRPNQFVARASGGITFYSDGASSSGVELAPGSGAWSSLSDRTAKENFSPVNTREVLDRLASVPIKTWNYKSQDPKFRHIGPVAQDFAAAFSVGEDDKHITTVDADGVALAAIQGLNEIVQEKDARIAVLEQRLAELEKMVSSLAGRQFRADQRKRD